MTAHRHARVMPSRKRYDESTKDDFKLPDFTIRPAETLIPTMDLRLLVDNMDNQGDE